VGPDAVVSASLGLVFSCVEKEDVIHFAVIVRVINGEVCPVCGCQPACFSYCFGGPAVLAVHVLAVVLVRLAECHDRRHVENEVVTSKELVVEVFPDACLACVHQVFEPLLGK